MFDDEEGKREREELASSAGDFLDAADNPFIASKRLRLFVVVEVLFLIFAALGASWIADLLIETYLYLVALAFGVGFVMTFTAWRLHQKTASNAIESDSIESGVMGGYNYASTQDRKWTMWLIAAIAGGVNAITFMTIVGIFK